VRRGPAIRKVGPAAAASIEASPESP